MNINGDQKINMVRELFETFVELEFGFLIFNFAPELG